MRAKMVIQKFLVVESMPMDLYGVVGLAICRHAGCIWLDAEPKFNGTKIIFIGQSCGSYCAANSLETIASTAKRACGKATYRSVQTACCPRNGIVDASTSSQLDATNSRSVSEPQNEKSIGIAYACHIVENLAS